MAAASVAQPMNVSALNAFASTCLPLFLSDSEVLPKNDRIAFDSALVVNGLFDSTLAMSGVSIGFDMMSEFNPRWTRYSCRIKITVPGKGTVRHFLPLPWTLSIQRTPKQSDSGMMYIRPMVASTSSDSHNPVACENGNSKSKRVEQGVTGSSSKRSII